MSNMNDSILDLIESDGTPVRHVASTGGGELAGPCPKCGGQDRFRVWPEQGDGGRWWCRQCNHGGDLIEYLRWMRGMDFKEACLHLGRPPSTKWEPIGRRLPHQQRKSSWKPKQAEAPVSLWTAKTGQLVEWAEGQPWAKQQESVRRWLHEERGLSDQTIKAARLGWLPKDFFPDREAWGLPEKLKENGERTKLYLPKGLVIPLLAGKEIARIRIRRPDPDVDSRYYTLPGSSMSPMITGRGPVAMVLESELDALLLAQVAGDLCRFIGLGSAQAKPDRVAIDALKASPRILVSLDSDDAGAKAAWGWWLKHFEQAKRWPVIDGKDPTEAWQNGLDLREWTLAGIEDASQEETAGSETTEGIDEEAVRELWEERAAIMEYEGCLSREEAEEGSSLIWHPPSPRKELLQ